MKNFLTTLGDRTAGFPSTFSEFDKIFSPFFNDSGIMRTDVKEYGDHYLLEMEVPGISKNNIDISVSDGYLTVSSTKTDKNDGTIDDWKYLKRERSVSATRSFYIGDANENDVKATYTDGLLYICIPKHAASGTAAKKIEIH